MQESNQNNFSNIILGIIIGAGIGLLFAPEKGTKTRTKIKEYIDDLKNNLKSKIADFQNLETNQEIDIKDNFDEFLKKSNLETQEIINLLEKKLEKMKNKTE